MSRFFLFKKPRHNENPCDQEYESLTFEQASKIPHYHKQLADKINSNKNRRRIRDGFVAGYQENLGVHVGGKLEYDKILKEKGLVEIGYDYVPIESKGNTDFFKTDEFISTCRDNDIEINEQEVSAIKSGEYFKD